MEKALTSTEKKDTRSLILDAAFSFYDGPRYEEFSLGQIAKKVGISKAAIFRHFSSKEALISAMEELVFDILAEKLQKTMVGRKTSKKLDSSHFHSESIARIFEYFAENTKYTFYFVHQFLSSPHYDSIFTKKLKDRGIEIEELNGNAENSLKSELSENLYAQNRTTWISTTMFFHLAARFFMKKDNEEIDSAEVFAKKMIAFLETGLNLKESISEQRLDQLDLFCDLSDAKIEPENKIFKALASVIKECGIQNVTVEKIAAKLNFAKSSLYSYFSKKSEMIQTLIFSEFENLKEIIIRKWSEAENYGELLYIQMRTIFNYMILRPSLIPVASWLRMSGNFMCDDTEEIQTVKLKTISQEEFSFLMMEPKLDENVITTRKIIEEWVSIMPVTFLVHGRSHHFTDETIGKTLRQIFTYIVKGIQVDFS